MLYDTDKVTDLTAEQKQTISNVLGTAGLVAGAVTSQATGADSISSVSAGQQVQGSVQNAVENNQFRQVPIRNPLQQQRRDIIARETLNIRRYLPDFHGIPAFRSTNQISEREVLELQAFSRFIQTSNQTYPSFDVAYRVFQRSPHYQNINTPISNQLNIGRNNVNFNVARHEQINNRTITFGQNANQQYHTWRHLEQQGINRSVAERSIRNDLLKRDLNAIPIGTTKGFEVMISGRQVQYYIHRIGINQYNIGRSHVKR